MHRVAIILLFAVSAFGAEQTFKAEDGGLKLEVSYQIIEVQMPPSLEKKTREEEPTFEVELTSILKNVSTREITLPTSTYEGGPTCWNGNPESMLYACFDIGFRRIEDRLLQVSPYRYFPVTLKPGESVELPKHLVRALGKKRPVISWVRVEYSVDQEYGARHGWWTGTLRYEVIDEKKRPIQPPEPMRAKGPHGSP